MMKADGIIIHERLNECIMQELSKSLNLRHNLWLYQQIFMTGQGIQQTVHILHVVIKMGRNA